MNRNDILRAVKYTDRDIIDKIIESYYFIDYGIIDKVSDDKKTVDVIHAIKPVLMDDTIMDETVTKEVELLYPCCENFSINWEVKKDDLVLLVGTKDLVKVDGLEEANKPKMYSHYQQENLKAIPFGTKTADSKTTLKITADLVDLQSEEEINIGSEEKIKLVSDKEIEFESDTDYKVTATDSVTFETKEYSSTADTSIEMKVDDNNNINIDVGGIDIKGTLINMNAATEEFIKGNTFCTALLALCTAIATATSGSTAQNASGIETIKTAFSVFNALINNFKSTTIKGE
jgi:hypothetical protein